MAMGEQVTLAGSSALFPYLSLKIKPVMNDSLRISQKWEESSFISSSLTSGHFWVHDKWITASFAWQRGTPHQ